MEFSLGNRVSGGFSGIISEDINFKRCEGKVNDTVSNIISDIIVGTSSSVRFAYSRGKQVSCRDLPSTCNLYPRIPKNYIPS